jgi:hypothetical protein
VWQALPWIGRSKRNEVLWPWSVLHDDDAEQWSSTHGLSPGKDVMSKPKLKEISQQVIVITGASSGIGLATTP